MRRISAVIVGVAAVALLAGCSAVNAEAASQTVPTASVAPSATSSSTPSAAPIVMSDAPDAPKTAAQKAGFKDANDWYLRSIKSAWSGDMPSDHQLLDAASLACGALVKGTPRNQIHVVTGEGDAVVNNNRNVIQYSIMAICPKPR